MGPVISMPTDAHVTVFLIVNLSTCLPWQPALYCPHALQTCSSWWTFCTGIQTSCFSNALQVGSMPACPRASCTAHTTSFIYSVRTSHPLGVLSHFSTSTRMIFLCVSIWLRRSSSLVSENTPRLFNWNISASEGPTMHSLLHRAWSGVGCLVQYLCLHTCPYLVLPQLLWPVDILPFQSSWLKCLPLKAACQLIQVWDKSQTIGNLFYSPLQGQPPEEPFPTYSLCSHGRVVTDGPIVHLIIQSYTDIFWLRCLRRKPLASQQSPQDFYSCPCFGATFYIARHFLTTSEVPQFQLCVSSVRIILNSKVLPEQEWINSLNWWRGEFVQI